MTDMPEVAMDVKGMETFDEGIDYALSQLCEFLGVEETAVTWDAATETLDGDVRAVIGSILRAHFGEDWGRAMSEAKDVKGLSPQFVQNARLTARINTDGAAADRILLALAGCALAWEADARLVGNVRASDIARAVYENATALSTLSRELAEARSERDMLVQTSAMLCEECGWSMKFPDEGCVNCRALAAEAAFASKDERIRELEAALARTDAARDVLAERQRQVTVEGWTPKHDDQHSGGEMARAASCYAAHASAWQRIPVKLEAYQAVEYCRLSPGWPWAAQWWKPTNPRRDLVKAGALILAEIERLDRARSTKEPT